MIIIKNNRNDFYDYNNNNKDDDNNDNSNNNYSNYNKELTNDLFIQTVIINLNHIYLLKMIYLSISD